MFKQYVNKLALLSLLSPGIFFISGCYAIDSSPKYIILMISDGCGYNHVAAVNYYEYGRSDTQVYEKFPVKYGMSTYPAPGGDYDPELFWSDFSNPLHRPTDSAAAITAMSTGIKTYNGALCVDVDGQALIPFIERVEDSGRSTGVVTTVQFTHATPAGLMICNPDRGQYETIGQAMLLHSRSDVIMGAGHPLYDNNAQQAKRPSYRYVGGQSTWEILTEGKAVSDADGDGVGDAWTLIEEREDFLALVDGPTPKRVLGIPKVRETLQQERPGDPFANPFEVPFISTVPTLAEMTRGALNVLETNPRGFFLMVEGGAIDWASHDNQMGRMIEEEIAFNQAVEAVVAWISTHKLWEETLLIVTGDHETGYLAGPPPETGENITCPFLYPLVNRGKGNLPDMQWYSRQHTNALIPIYAKGKGSELFHHYADEIDPIRGPYLDNAELGEILCRINSLYTIAVNPADTTTPIKSITPKP